MIHIKATPIFYPTSSERRCDASKIDFSVHSIKLARQMEPHQLLPTDIIKSLIVVCELFDRLAVVNSLARTCHALADFVRTHAEQIAEEYVSAYQQIPNPPLEILARTLPNGTRHGNTIVDVGKYKQIAIEYRFGAPTYWQVSSRNKYGIVYNMWGMVGSPYMLDCEGVTFSEASCDVIVNIGVAENCMQNVSGRCDFGNAWNLLEVRPLKGYLVDGRIQPNVIEPWMRKIAELMDRDVPPEHKLGHRPHTRARGYIFRAHEIMDLRTEFGDEFDHLESR